jgi:hypothetical protein
MPRKLTQERIDEIVKRYRPRGWRVSQSRHRWDWSSASANPARRTLYVPTLKDDDSLFLYLHEVGHIVLKHFDNDLPAHREEFEAERFAVHVFRTENIPVTKLILSDLRDRLCSHISADMKRGVKIQRHIARWAKHRCSSGRRAGR